ncbi:cell surface glycoprotein CD200 receptor 1-B-like [Pelodytes ibericus]
MPTQTQLEVLLCLKSEPIMQLLQRTFSCVYLVIAFVKNLNASGVFMSVLSGTTAILHCLPDPRITTIMITWKADLLYNPSCLMSIGDTSSYNNCTERAIQKPLTLEILNTHITDTGNYTCELVTSAGTFFKRVILHVLVSPSVSLGFDSGGFPECRAVGGNPAANISWIPESDNVTNRSEMDPNKTWTVISTYRASVISGMEVTCIVSHPTFTHPETRSIADPNTCNNRPEEVVKVLVLEAEALCKGMVKVNQFENFQFFAKETSCEPISDTETRGDVQYVGAMSAMSICALDVGTQENEYIYLIASCKPYD